MRKEYLCAAIAIFFWSTLAVTSKLLLKSLSNIEVLFVSSLFAGLVLLVFNIETGKLKALKNYKIKDYLIIALIGLPGIFLYHIFYYAGTDKMLASQAFIINYMWPIMSVVFASVILKEKMTLRKAIAIMVSFLGVVIVTGGELREFNKDMLTGAMFCIMGAISYGLFTVLNKKIYYDKCISMMINFLVTFIITGTILVLKKDLFTTNYTQLLGLAWNGIFTMAVPNTLWILALEHGNTAKISNLAYITPFVSLLWTSLILKEQLSVYFVMGLLVIVAGIFIQLKDKKTGKMLR